MIFTFEFFKNLGLPVYIFIFIVAICLLWGGIMTLTAKGDPQKETKGKRILLSTIAGLFLILLTVFTVKLVNDFLKKEGVFQPEETEFKEEFPPAPPMINNFPPSP